MTQTLKLTLSALLLSLLAGLGVFLLANSSFSSEEARVQKMTYGTDFASTEKDTFTVMSYNLGGSSDTNTPDRDSLSNVTPAIKLIRQVRPDIIGLQNVELRATRPASPPPLEAMATRLGIPEAIHSGSRQSFLLGPPSGAAGQAVLSRFPIRRYVGRSRKQSFWRISASSEPFVQIAALDVGGWPLIVMNVHLHKSDPKIRTEQVLEIMELYGRLSKQSFPILVVGTFNSLMPAAAPAASTRRTAMGLLLKRTNLLPSLSSETAQLSGESVATYPADRPRRKIDYILHNPSYIIPTNAEVVCGSGTRSPAQHCAVTMSFLLPRPKDKLPEKRIPDNRLPSLTRLLSDSLGG